MIQLLIALSFFSYPAIAEEQVRWPSYCIRSATTNNDGTFLLDMPGWPYGMDDRPILVSNLDGLENTTNCTPDDPRM